MKLRSGVYIVPTNHWHIERTVWLIAGIVLLIATLAAFVQPLWAPLIIAMGVSSVTVALTGFCVAGNILKRAGFASRRMVSTGWAPNRAWHRRPTALLSASLPSARRQSMAAFDGPGRSTDTWQLISG